MCLLVLEVINNFAKLKDIYLISFHRHRLHPSSFDFKLKLGFKDVSYENEGLFGRSAIAEGNQNVNVPCHRGLVCQHFNALL